MADAAKRLSETPTAQSTACSKDELRRWAQLHPLLGALDPKSLETVMGLSTMNVFRSKRTVFRAGDPPRFAYLLLNGTVRVFHRNGRGEELTTELLKAPAVFNDARVLTQSVVDENAVTLEPSKMLCVPGEVFRRLATSRPQFSQVLVRDQAARACVAIEQQRQLAFEDIETRVANLLLDYASLVGVEKSDGTIRLQFPLSQQSMAKDLGASRKSVNRALERLRAAGAVEKADARYEIRDKERIFERCSDPVGIRHSTDGSTLERLERAVSDRSALD